MSDNTTELAELLRDKGTDLISPLSNPDLQDRMDQVLRSTLFQAEIRETLPGVYICWLVNWSQWTVETWQLLFVKLIEISNV